MGQDAQYLPLATIYIYIYTYIIILDAYIYIYIYIYSFYFIHHEALRQALSPQHHTDRIVEGLVAAHFNHLSYGEPRAFTRTGIHALTCPSTLPRPTNSSLKLAPKNAATTPAFYPSTTRSAITLTKKLPRNYTNT